MRLPSTLFVLALVVVAAGTTPAVTARQAAASSNQSCAPNARCLRLALLGHEIGTETTTIDRVGELSTLKSHFEYHDRGTPVALDATLTYRDDFTPVSYEAHGKSYRYFNVDASVKDVAADGHTFTIEGMAPIAVQGVLIRYWLAHGRPERIRVVPSGDEVRIQETGTGPGRMRGFAIEGIIWGRTDVDVDGADLHVVDAATTAGVLPFEAYKDSRARLLLRARTPMRLTAAGYPQQTLHPRETRTFALVGARLIGGNDSKPIERTTVLVRDGRIAQVSSGVAVPHGVPAIDVTGKTIMPGLWDMHAHVGQPEWGLVYLASGVTTIRDMGGEFDLLTQFRDAWGRQRRPSEPAASAGVGELPALLGPRLLLAGLVDGPGPASFGDVTAGSPEEGRSVVARYKRAGFQQMKLYNLLERPTVKAIIDAAHANGMTVTGHIPNGMTLKELVEMGADQVAHLVVRGTPGSDELKETIAFLRAHGTVMDPTISWNELLGRSPSTPIASFQPGIERVAPPLRRLLEGANGGNVTPEQARERLSRQLAIIKALHDAGIPIVAGTDKGVPGFSVQREIELYVQAGLTPMEAIRAATAVPAKVMGLEKDSGTIAPGLRADVIVVDGNPLERISDIRNVTMVCANGRLFDTAPLWKAGGYR